MTDLIVKYDTYENWNTSNPILESGVVSIDTTNNKAKIGDGSTHWNDLAYSTDDVSTTIINQTKGIALVSGRELVTSQLLYNPMTNQLRVGADGNGTVAAKCLKGKSDESDVTNSIKPSGTLTRPVLPFQMYYDTDEDCVCVCTDYANNIWLRLRDINDTSRRIFVANKSLLPHTGDITSMYITEDTGKWYLWNGTTYIESDNMRRIVSELNSIVSTSAKARDSANEYAESALESKNAAQSSADASKLSATSSLESKNAAATSASNAKDSASSILGAVETTTTKAKESSDNAAIALSYKNDAESYKDAAATSAEEAKRSATSAAAGQINVDWNSTSGVTQILNKPNIDQAVTKDSTNLITSGAVDSAISTAITNAKSTITEAYTTAIANSIKNITDANETEF